MPAPFARLGPGERVPLDRATWEGLTDAARAARSKPGPNAPEFPPTQFTSQTTIWVRNDSGAAVPAFGALALSAPLIDPRHTHQAARETPAFSGIKPSSYSDPFAVLMEPAPIGATVRAAVMGVVPAMVTIVNAGDAWAGTDAAGGTWALTSDPDSGPTRVLASAGATGTVWCLVLLQFPSGPGTTTTTTTTTSTTTTAAPSSCSGSCQWTYSSGTWTKSSSTCGTGCSCFAPTFCPQTSSGCTVTACGQFGTDQTPPDCSGAGGGTGTTTTPGPSCTTTTTTPGPGCTEGCVWSCQPPNGWRIASNGCSSSCPCSAPAIPCTSACDDAETPCQVPPPPPPPFCNGSCRWVWDSTLTKWVLLSSSCAGSNVPNCGCDPPGRRGDDCGDTDSTECYVHGSPTGSPPCQTPTTTTNGPGCSGQCLWGSSDGSTWSVLQNCPGCLCTQPGRSPTSTCDQIQTACFAGTTTTTTTASCVLRNCYFGPNCGNCEYKCLPNGQYSLFLTTCTGDCSCVPLDCVQCFGNPCPYDPNNPDQLFAVECSPGGTTPGPPTTSTTTAAPPTTTTTAAPPTTTTSTTSAPTTTSTTTTAAPPTTTTTAAPPTTTSTTSAPTTTTAAPPTTTTTAAPPGSFFWCLGGTCGATTGACYEAGFLCCTCGGETAGPYASQADCLTANPGARNCEG